MNRDPEAVRDRLREIANAIYVHKADQEDMIALRDLADWFDEAHKARPFAFFDNQYDVPKRVPKESWGPDMLDAAEKAHQYGVLRNVPDEALPDETSLDAANAIIAGGQGRTAASVEDDAVGMFRIVAWCVLAVVGTLAAFVLWVVL